MSERSAEAAKKIIPFAQSKDNSPFALPSKEDIPFAPRVRDVAKPKEPRVEGDPVDRSGHAIVALLQEAAETANMNCDRAMDLAHKLSIQLREAEERMREMELELRHYQDRAQRAEKWLIRIYNDIEERFFDNKVPGSGQTPQR